jgi:hypothetical protein
MPTLYALALDPNAPIGTTAVTFEGSAVALIPIEVTGGGDSDLVAVTYAPDATVASTAIHSARSANQLPDDGSVGLTNLGSDTTDSLPPITGEYATVSGGDQNATTTGASAPTYASVGGGLNNLASAEYARVGGGTGNSAGGAGACIPGGIGNTASDTNSYAEGNGNLSEGIASHAEGSVCVAAGADSHAEGNSCECQGDHSHAQGCGAYALYETQDVIAGGPNASAPTAATCVQKSEIVWRGFTDSESVVALGYGEASPPTNTGIALTDGKVYQVIVEAAVQIPATPQCGAHKLSCVVRCAGGVATIAGTGTVEVFGDATYTASGSVMAFTIEGGNVLQLSWQSGFDGVVTAWIVASMRIIEIGQAAI